MKSLKKIAILLVTFACATCIPGCKALYKPSAAIKKEFVELSNFFDLHLADLKTLENIRISLFTDFVKENSGAYFSSISFTLLADSGVSCTPKRSDNKDVGVKNSDILNELNKNNYIEPIRTILSGLPSGKIIMYSLFDRDNIEIYCHRNGSFYIEAFYPHFNETHFPRNKTIRHFEDIQIDENWNLILLNMSGAW